MLPWQAAPVEAALRPDLPIIDPHLHFWGDGPLRPHFGRALPEDVGAMITASGHRIVATVFVECFWGYRKDGPEGLRYVGETETVAAAARAWAAAHPGAPRLAAAIMGSAELRAGDRVAEALEAHVAAAPERFRGIRYVTSADPDEPYGGAERMGILGSAMFREGVGALDRMGLIFETWCLHTQIEELLALADAYPNLPVVIDHLATPIRVGRYADRREEAMAEWRAGIAAAARRPNVVLKLGGLGMAVAGFGWADMRGAPPRSEQIATAYRPFVRHALETFGPERCMFESNFPVDGTSYGYGALWNAFKRITDDLSPDERDALFRGTAARVYRIEG